MWNSTRGGNDSSEGRALVHIGSGTKANSVLRINYADNQLDGPDFGAGTQIDGKLTINPSDNTTQGLIINNPKNDTNIVNNISSLSDFNSFERQ